MIKPVKTCGVNSKKSSHRIPGCWKSEACFNGFIAVCVPFAVKFCSPWDLQTEPRHARRTEPLGQARWTEPPGQVRRDESLELNYGGMNHLDKFGGLIEEIGTCDLTNNGVVECRFGQKLICFCFLFVKIFAFVPLLSKAFLSWHRRDTIE